jgi:predicted deacylase
MADTLITSEIDFEAEGKHSGFLRLPHSVHRSAYGWIPVPIVMIKNGAGPTTLLISGNHGDEFEAQIALSKLCRELSVEDIRGRLIILTMANYPAALASLRTSPIDGGNLNRTFPGNALGTPTEAIAHYIEEVLMPMCDYMFDFHSGGSSLDYLPSLLRGRGHSPKETQQLRALQKAFDAPYAWVFTSGGGRNTTARTAMGAAGRKGVISIMAELGGGGTVSREILALTERGIKRLLHCIGMLPAYQLDAANGTRELQVAGTIPARSNGLFEPYLDLGDETGKGCAVGAIHLPEEPWSEPTMVHSPYDGMVLCKRVQGRVERGDGLYQIAIDSQEHTQ